MYKRLSSLPEFSSIRSSAIASPILSSVFQGLPINSVLQKQVIRLKNVNAVKEGDADQGALRRIYISMTVHD